MDNVFERDAHAWWDESGYFAPLHALNKVRVPFIVAPFREGASTVTPLEGTHFLDIGCGGGLLTEPLARLGAHVRGLDQGKETIEIAMAHAQAMGLSIEYICGDLGELDPAQAQFDGVVLSEVIEHVANPRAFLQQAGALVKPGGYLYVTTLNRTLFSYLTAIVLAERVLKVVQKGAHDWQDFKRPSEILEMVAGLGFAVDAMTGMLYTPWNKTWRTIDYMGGNYMMRLKKGAA